jgi:hypothetical protein
MKLISIPGLSSGYTYIILYLMTEAQPAFESFCSLYQNKTVGNTSNRRHNASHFSFFVVFLHVFATVGLTGAFKVLTLIIYPLTYVPGLFFEI